MEYFTECISSETQKENKIRLLHNKQLQLNNTADTINTYLATVIRIIYIKTNYLYAKPCLLIWLAVIGYTYEQTM